LRDEPAAAGERASERTAKQTQDGPTPSTSSAERRQLTVIFCDLVGSTAMASRLDPGDLREVIGAYHKCVAETIGRFDGFVAKYMGDGVLAYFGYPRAHEDDAERAIRAGLGVIDEVGRLSGRFCQRAVRQEGERQPENNRMQFCPALASSPESTKR